MKTITLIGNGKMSIALAKSFGKKYNIKVVGRDKTKLALLKKDMPHIQTLVYDEVQSLSDDIVFFCVKPYALGSVSKYLKDKNINILISILAGTKLQDISKEIPAKNYFRLMPNVACKYQKSMNTLTGETYDKNIVKLCESFGNTLWVNSENELDIATAIAGSGPAFLALIAESIEDAGVQLGLQRADSSTLTKGLFESFGVLIKNSDARNLITEITSPNGTTAQGLGALEKHNVRYGIMEAIVQAYKKTQK